MTSMSSYGTSNSSCASITSSPLFTMVAELIVTTGPMSQVGCLSASSGVTSASSSRRRPRNAPAAGGQHQPPHLGPRPAAQALRQRRVLGVDRDDLPRPRHRGLDQRAAGDERLLVGQREGTAGSAARPASAPARATPTTPLSTTSQGHCGQLGHRVRPGHDLRDAEVAGGVPALLRLGVEGELQVLHDATPGPPRPPRRPARAPARRAARRCRRRRRARPPGTGPGCGARCRWPGCRSTRSSRAARSRGGCSPAHSDRPAHGVAGAPGAAPRASNGVREL